VEYNTRDFKSTNSRLAAIPGAGEAKLIMGTY